MIKFMESSNLFIDFDSLPYPLFDSDWEVLKRYREEAVRREEEIQKRKKKQTEELLLYVANRLNEWGTRRKEVTTKQYEERVSNVSRVFKTPVDTSQQQALQYSSVSGTTACTTDSHPVHHRHIPAAAPTTGYTSTVMTPSFGSGIPIRSPPNKGIIPQKNENLYPPPRANYLRGHHSPTMHFGYPVSYDTSRPFQRESTEGHLRNTYQTNSLIIDPLCIISAVAKGFLTRRLLSCEKIKDIITTIKDAELVLQSLDSPGSMQEFDLQQRVINQLQTAKLKLHHIFFELSSRDKMAYITHSRNLRRDRQLKKLQLQEMKKAQRLSTATIKSIERKKKHSPVAPPVKKGPTKRTSTGLSSSHQVHSATKSHSSMTATGTAKHPSNSLTTSSTRQEVGSINKRNSGTVEKKQKGRQKLHTAPHNTKGSATIPSGPESETSEPKAFTQSSSIGSAARTKGRGGAGVMPTRIPPPSTGRFQKQATKLKYK